jgi:hypothetical protein
MIIAALLLSACGAATETTADEMTESGQRFLLALPRLEVNIDENGEVAFAGLTMDDISQLTGLQMQPLAVNPFYVDWMKNTNMQHMELVHTDNGIFLYANGELLPYLAWDGDSLSNVGSVAGMANVPFSGLIGLLVPIIERTGLDMVVRFPLQEDAEEIALRDPTVAPEPVPADGEEKSVITHVDIDYDENGVPMLAGITSRDVLASTGLGLPVELTPETIAQIQALGIEEIQFQSNGEGVFILVNEMPLPHVAWSNDLLESGADLYAQVNPDSPYIALANLLLPELNNVDLDMRVRFPTQ